MTKKDAIDLRVGDRLIFDKMVIKVLSVTPFHPMDIESNFEGVWVYGKVIFDEIPVRLGRKLRVGQDFRRAFDILDDVEVAND